MSENKKNPVAAIVFVMFVIVFPIVTVFFSKKGLDKYKGIRSEMQFLKDSIRVDFDHLSTYYNSNLSNELVRGKLIVTGFWSAHCQEEMTELVDSLKAFRNNFRREDQGKLLFVIHTDDFSQDSTWSLAPYLDEWKVDTSKWKFAKGISKERYRLKNGNSCSTITVLDGRVSKKDDSGDYKNGPLLCDHYNLKDKEAVEQLLRHMALIMPVKARKKIEYKADEKLY